MRMFARLLCVFGVLMTGLAPAHADTRYQRGPFGPDEALAAPEWQVAEWIRGPESKLAELRGRVVVIDFFQLWCPGCNRFSIPLMSHWEKQFAAEIAAQKMTLVSIHTVFEGHDYQTNDRLRKFVADKGMHHPVAVDHQTVGERVPDTMRLFRTRGTPEMAIIDKRGRIRFQKLGAFDVEWATAYLRELLAEPG